MKQDGCSEGIAMYRCGHCGERHERAEQGRACSNQVQTVSRPQTQLGGIQSHHAPPASIEGPNDPAPVPIERTQSNSNRRCRHEMVVNACVYCKPPPPGIQPTVYITKGGDHFHNRDDCPALHSGWEKASSHLQETHPVRSVSWTEVVNTRDRCRTCVPPPPA